MTYVWIAVGSALGGMARHWIGETMTRLAGGAFPWGTILVNVSGSFLIGVLSSLTLADGRLMLSPTLRAFLMVGLCGGYTTYSAFSLQTLVLARQGEWLRAGANVLLTTALCLVAVWLGHLLAIGWSQSRAG